MKINDKELERFQTIYGEQFGEKLSKQEAFEKAQKLLQLVKLVYKPIPKKVVSPPIIKSPV